MIYCAAGEMANAQDLGSCAARLAGSSPAPRTSGINFYGRRYEKVKYLSDFSFVLFGSSML